MERNLTKAIPWHVWSHVATHVFFPTMEIFAIVCGIITMTDCFFLNCTINKIFPGLLCISNRIFTSPLGSEYKESKCQKAGAFPVLNREDVTMCNVNLEFDCRDDEIKSLLNPYCETLRWIILLVFVNLLKSFWKEMCFNVIKKKNNLLALPHRWTDPWTTCRVTSSEKWKKEEDRYTQIHYLPGKITVLCHMQFLPALPFLS